MNTAAEQAVAAQQQAITTPAPLFVRACPGAGKTHVIVTRHLRGPAATLRGGRALLSYTRAAAQQIRDRCHRLGRPDATEYPHYIGTLDGFIWNHLVIPHRPPDRALQLLDSWDRVNAAVTLNHRTVPLSAFTFVCRTGTFADDIRRDLLPPAYASLIQSSGRCWDDWVREVYTVRRAYCTRGYVTGHEARQLALQYLDRDPDLVHTLRSRFAEIVVDEAQDCSATDLEIFDRLHRLGLPLVVVADPDQMIYGWRDADPARLADLENGLGTTITLDGNWRSTSTVCQLANTLRAGTRPPDIAVQTTASDPPVILLPAVFTRTGNRHLPSGRPITEIFLQHARHHGISPQQCLTTAHRRSHLPTARRPIGGNPATRLAHAWRVLHSATADPGLVDGAYRAGARVLLRYWYPHLDQTSSLEDQCAAVGIDTDVVARHAFAFLYALPEPGPRWPKSVNEWLKNGPRPAGAAPQRTIGYLRGAVAYPPGTGHTGEPCPTDNVHQVKGAEYEAVLLLVPDDDVGSRWVDGDPAADEQLRTWYVAVTRAQRLLAIGLAAEQLPAITEHLRHRNVPVRIG
ncbi:UvrD-helicase domain-containing protein [Actinoplanes sp. NPDC020271]|uniref:UvrD-helicase domain-containing protein n=1 Tax=Actinoplanes sp. NPDC020271 TaxID=3363896 RepID=UPI0037A17A5F